MCACGQKSRSRLLLPLLPATLHHDRFHPILTKTLCEITGPAHVLCDDPSAHTQDWRSVQGRALPWCGRPRRTRLPSSGLLRRRRYHAPGRQHRPGRRFASDDTLGTQVVLSLQRMHAVAPSTRLT
jgi:hypothetical protein